MKILGKEINNKDGYEKLWNIFKKVNAISSSILGVIGALWTLGVIMNFIENGVLELFISSSSPFITGVLIACVPVVSLILLGVPNEVLRKKERDKEQNIYYFFILAISGIIFIVSLLGLLGIFAFFSTLNIGTVIPILLALFLMIVSGLCIFTSILWVVIFHNNWEQHCKKVEDKKNMKTARIEKQNSDKKKEIEIEAENKLLEKLNLKKKKLQEIKDLFEENLISKKEYEEMRKKIIERED